MLRRSLLTAALVASTFVLAAQAQEAKPTAAKVAATPATAATAKSSANPQVVLHTNMGDITLELDGVKAPKSTANFLEYVKAKHYDGTVFHRVIKDFMVQGGGFTRDLNQKPTRAPITNEADNGLSNVRGSVAMARTGDPDSATAQFFINVVDTPRLDFVSKDSGATWGYAVFGKVVKGMDVVDRIREVETGPGGPLPSDVPKSAVVINSAELVSEK